MDMGAWWATVHGVAKSGHDQATNTFTSALYQALPAIAKLFSKVIV